MAATLEQLEQRLTALEREVHVMRDKFNGRHADITPADNGARLLRKARADKPRLSALWAESLASVVAPGDPLPPEQLRQLLLADGAKPEENLLSRGIREMREE